MFAGKSISVIKASFPKYAPAIDIRTSSFKSIERFNFSFASFEMCKLTLLIILLSVIFSDLINFMPEFLNEYPYVDGVVPFVIISQKSFK